MKKIDTSEITPEHIYINRRKFIGKLGLALAGAALLPMCQQASSPVASVETASAAPPPKDEPTPYKDITRYNNFYEFSTGKEEVWKLAKNFSTNPWTVRVGGLVNKPAELDIEGMIKLFKPEERIYRMRCVEAWSMVIPWTGFPLSRLIKHVDPKPAAKFVKFETLYDPARMPGQKSRQFPWPYVEGLRLDEAMNDLAMLATGIYGKPLLGQNGAPVRLVVPWKYGFKSIKSIVNIELTDEMPESLWMKQAPMEYGFYANVNPNVNHPRWSQATERRIGELRRRSTLPFNGYAEQVGDLYKGMDLNKHY